MSCDYPLTAWRSCDPDDFKHGKWKIVFRKDQGFPNTEMKIACGQCAGCRLDKARSWAIRCMHEAKLHADSCFITLTYNPEHLPENLSLRPEDMTLFLKRLRKALDPLKIRYFQCGEYGTLCKNCDKPQVHCRCGQWSPGLGRPHHHLLLFGFAFPDKLLIRSGDNPLYTSAFLSSLWSYGFHSIGDLTFDSACYTARYVMKKITGDKSLDHYGGRKPEYITMSRRPGLGRGWLELYYADVYNTDRLVVRHGFIARPPTYYDNLYQSAHADHFKIIKEKRKNRAIETSSKLTDEDRECRSEIRRLKMNQIPRGYEDNV